VKIREKLEGIDFFFKMKSESNHLTCAPSYVQLQSFVGCENKISIFHIGTIFCSYGKFDFLSPFRFSLGALKIFDFRNRFFVCVEILIFAIHEGRSKEEKNE